MNQTSIPPPLTTVPERGLLWRVAVATGSAIALVGLVGALVGARLSAGASLDGIQRRADALAAMVSARLAHSPAERHPEVVTRFNARVGNWVTVVDADGKALPGAPSPFDVP